MLRNADRVHHRLEDRRFVLLAGRQHAPPAAGHGPSQTTWTLVPKPPWDRPRAWSAGSLGRSAFFFSAPAAARLARTTEASTQNISQSMAPRPWARACRAVKDAVPQPAFAPAVEAAVDGLPGAEALGQVTPGSAGVQDPKDAVDHQAVVLVGVPGPVVLGQQAVARPPTAQW